MESNRVASFPLRLERILSGLERNVERWTNWLSFCLISCLRQSKLKHNVHVLNPPRALSFIHPMNYSKTFSFSFSFHKFSINLFTNLSSFTFKIHPNYFFFCLTQDKKLTEKNINRDLSGAKRKKKLKINKSIFIINL